MSDWKDFEFARFTAPLFDFSATLDDRKLTPREARSNKKQGRELRALAEFYIRLPSEGDLIHAPEWVY
jgi:hypothetical protein